MRHWLSDCDSHKDCKKSLSRTRKITRDNTPLPTRCIRISIPDSASSISPFRLALEETRGSSGQYICLSHRWCQVETERSKTLSSNYSQRTTEIASHSLEPLFNDVFLTAIRLGIEYVWIDSICIIQDSAEDWKAEAVRMSDYYENAAFTIMAAVPSERRAQGLFHLSEENLHKLVRLPYRDITQRQRGYFYLSSGLDGVTESILHSDIISSELLSRGWIFQEWALSRRIAWFTKHGVVLRCKCANSVRWDQFPLRWENSSWLRRARDLAVTTLHSPSIEAEPNPFGVPLDWHRIVGHYSTLNLSKPQKDRLIALSGIAQQYTAQTGDRTLCGLRSSQLHLDLLWQQKNPGPHSRLTSFPSWSWASLTGPVHWICGSFPQAAFVTLEFTSTPRPELQCSSNGDGEEEIEDNVEGDKKPRSSLKTPRDKALSSSSGLTGEITKTIDTLRIRGRLLSVIFGPVFDEQSTVEVLTASGYYPKAMESFGRVQPRSVSLAADPSSIAGWGLLESPDLQDDEAFARRPLLSALWVSTLKVRRDSIFPDILWGPRSVINVLFLCQQEGSQNGFVRVGVGRLLGHTVMKEFNMHCERDIDLV